MRNFTTVLDKLFCIEGDILDTESREFYRKCCKAIGYAFLFTACTCYLLGKTLGRNYFEYYHGGAAPAGAVRIPQPQEEAQQHVPAPVTTPTLEPVTRAIEFICEGRTRYPLIWYKTVLAKVDRDTIRATYGKLTARKTWEAAFVGEILHIS